MNTQSQQLAYVAPSSYMTRNGSHASLLDDDHDAFFGCDTKAAQSWESYLQPPFQNVYEESQLYYQNSGQDFKQSDPLLPIWASEDQDDPTSTHAINLHTSSPSKQSPETRVQPAVSNFGKGNGQKNFVRKLYDMLSDESAKPYIYWGTDGKSFTIENQEVFAKKVLKRYLKTENFQSFIRQLNMYDFHKINRAQRAQRGVQSQTPQYVFSHTKFRRDEPDNLSEIKRKGTEQQDAPPQYETLLSAGRFALNTTPSAQPVATVQPDFQVVVYQAEIQRLKQELGLLREDYNNLHNEYNSLRASLPVPPTVPMPQVQDTSSFSTTDYQPFYGGSASNQGLELNRSGNSFERDYSTSAPKPTEAPVSFQQFTGITHQSNTTKPATTSRISHESSPIAIRRRLSNAPAPDTSTNTQPTPRQPQGQAKARPSSWYENVGQWLGLNPTAGSHDEPGLSTQGNALGQDTQMTHTVNHGRNTLGGRAQPVVTVVMANRRQLP